MTSKEQRAAASTTTPKQLSQTKSYHTDSHLSKAARIANRRADMPKAYRRNYDKAMTGKSLKAAAKAFCLECVQWDRNEVKLCPDVACSLWLYRPFVCSKKHL